jgi:hypothetical protein
LVYRTIHSFLNPLVQGLLQLSGCSLIVVQSGNPLFPLLQFHVAEDRVLNHLVALILAL